MCVAKANGLEGSEAGDNVFSISFVILVLAFLCVRWLWLCLFIEDHWIHNGIGDHGSPFDIGDHVPSFF